MRVLALIGARSGSKGVPGKNVRALGGRPLLSYAVSMASRCQRLDRVLLSTDSIEYAAIGREYGAETPFLRPASIAADASTDLEYVRHALAWLEENDGYRPDIVVRLCPTVPLFRSEDVDQCIGLLAENQDAHSVIAISEAHEHPRKAVRIASDGLHVVSYMTEKGADLNPGPRQSYPDAYNRQGLPVASWISTIRNHDSLVGDNVRFHLVPRETAIDIDTEFDFSLAEMLLARANGTT